MVVLGLTGSIGMGKSTTAQLFREAGIAVHDADAAVHELYAGPAAAAIEAAFPGTTRNGVVDRAALGKRVFDDAAAMARLEQLIHPLVRDVREAFLQSAKTRGDAVVVLDIPLLFETGAEKFVDAVVVVTAPKDVQEARVLARSGMTRARLDAILAKQIPDSDKRWRADFIIDTSEGLDSVRRKIAEVLRAALVRPGRRPWVPAKD